MGDLEKQIEKIEKTNTTQFLAKTILDTYNNRTDYGRLKESKNNLTRIQTDIPTEFRIYLKHMKKLRHTSEKKVMKEIILSHITLLSKGDDISMF